MSEPSPRAVKICGIRDADAAIAAATAGATHLGFVFFRKSPRHVSVEDAEEIILELKDASFDQGFDMPACVGLFVDAGERELAQAAPLLTHFQFHGHETPARCEEMGADFGVDVIKAIPVAGAGDVAAAAPFQGAADILLFDAKPPPGAGRPGGHGETFDWSILKDYQSETGFFVAGGLTPALAPACLEALAGHPSFLGLDVSSGVESAPGVKSAEAIRQFVAAARG